MKRIFIGLCVCASAGVATAATFEDGLRLKQQEKFAAAAEVFAAVATREPKNDDVLSQLATVQGWLSRFDAAIETWRRAITLNPRKAEHRVGLARVLYWKGQRSESRAELERALALAPANPDVLTLKGDVLLADREPESARQAYLQAQRLKPNDADLAEKLARLAAPRLWRLDVGVTGDEYSNARGGENSAFAQLGYRLVPGVTTYARYDRYDNFDSRDHGLSAGAYWQPHELTLLQFEAGVPVDDNDFRPNAAAAINADLLLEGALQPLLGVRYFRYSQGGGHTITPGLRVLFAPFTAELRYGFTENTDDSSTGVFSSRLTLEQGRFAPYLAYTQGSEALPPLAKADIRIIGTGCVWNLSDAWGLRLDYSYEDREAIYTHHALGAGLTYRF